MTSYIEQQIALRRTEVERVEAEIAEAHQRILLLKAEIGAYEDALKHQPKARRSSRSGGAKQGQSQRGLSQVWREVIAFIAIHAPDYVSLDQVYHAVDQLGHTLRHDSIRSHMATLVKHGYVTRVSPGMFVVSSEQAQKANVTDSDQEVALRAISKKEPPDHSVAGGSVSSHDDGKVRSTSSEGASPSVVSSQRRGLMSSASFPGLPLSTAERR